MLTAGLATAQLPTTSHPGWDPIDLVTPAIPGFQPRVTGIDWLSDGTMVLLHWGGSYDKVQERQRNSKVYLLRGVTGDRPSPSLQLFADSLEDAMGLVVRRDTVFVSGGNEIVKLLDTNFDRTADVARRVFLLSGAEPGVMPPKVRHEFLFGMLERNDTFFVAPSVPGIITSGPCNADSSPNPYRGRLLAVSGATGKFRTIAQGFRQPNGMGWGPEGEVFVSDVQGNWLPTNKLIHAEEGRFYGYRQRPADIPPNTEESHPALYLVNKDIAAAPGNPLRVDTGLYAGQILMGDVAYGGIQRYFLEKVKGHYQGAVFHFSGGSSLAGLTSGVNKISWGPDGMLYVGQIGDKGGWSWPGNPRQFGLQKLKPNGKTAFEMLAIRVLPAGLEIEFTKPVDSAVALDSANYLLQTFTTDPTCAYGGNKLLLETPGATGLKLSADRRRVSFGFSTFREGRIVQLRLLNYVSESGEPIWTQQAWYSLNHVPSAAVVSKEIPVAGTRSLSRIRLVMRNQALAVMVPSTGTYSVSVWDSKGVLRASLAGKGPQERVIPLGTGKSGVYHVRIGSAAGDMLRSIVIP